MPPIQVQTKEANYIVPAANLVQESERLMPATDNAVEISDLEQYYAHIKGQEIDPSEWGFFKLPRYNFAVRKPVNFILQQADDSSLGETIGDGIVVIGGPKDDEDNPAILLMASASATMVEPSKAIEIEDTTLVPGIVSSYTDLGVDGYRGYSGFKAWVKVEEGQDPKDTFFLPEISSHSGTPDGEMSRLQKSAPSLGALCSRQMNAVVSWLAEVPIENRVVSS